MDVNVLEKIVTAGSTAKKTNDALRELGYPDSPYFHIYGNIVDALYMLLGEQTDTIDQSVTFKIMESTKITDQQRARMFSMICDMV